jgi:hypothetical protein
MNPSTDPVHPLTLVPVPSLNEVPLHYHTRSRWAVKIACVAMDVCALTRLVLVGAKPLVHEVCVMPRLLELVVASGDALVDVVRIQLDCCCAVSLESRTMTTG